MFLTFRTECFVKVSIMLALSGNSSKKEPKKWKKKKTQEKSKLEVFSHLISDESATRIQAQTRNTLKILSMVV